MLFALPLLLRLGCGHSFTRSRKAPNHSLTSDDVSHSESEDQADCSVQTFGCRRLGSLDWNPIIVLNQDGHTAAQSDITPSLRLSLGSNGCFVHRYAVYCDEAAHVVEPWRDDPEKNDKTEYILRQLGVVPKNFTLEDAMNRQWLAPEWHKGMDKWGMWTWALSPISLGGRGLCPMERMGSRCEAPSLIGFSLNYPARSGAQRTMEYDILISNPNGLIGSDPAPLLRKENGYFYLYYPGPDGHLHRQFPSGRPLHPFTSPGAPLNPFLIAFSSLKKLEAPRNALESRNIALSSSPHDSYYHQLRHLMEELYEPLDQPAPGGRRAINPRIPACFSGTAPGYHSSRPNKYVVQEFGDEFGDYPASNQPGG
ncbi:hypothetical protein C8R47DRAFT_1063446 [Mycena vitilis]|nr:hypothetical protein C8R47DRAFT_1063446 [Mycena vitilis]